MMNQDLKKNAKLVLLIFFSLLDELLVFVLLLVILPLFGFKIPFWTVLLIALILLGVSIPIFRALRKNPQLGFENMVGEAGMAITPLGPKGTVRIHGELWSAVSRREKIEPGSEIIVVEQNGLLLVVNRRDPASGN